MIDASQWWAIVRRSFGVPDVVGDEVAYDRIASLLVPDPAVGFGGDVTARNRAMRRVVDAVTVFAAAGRLDGFLVAEAAVDQVAETISNAPPEEGSVLVEDPLDLIAIRFVLEMLGGFMERHPFDATAPYISDQAPTG